MDQNGVTDDIDIHVAGIQYGQTAENGRSYADVNRSGGVNEYDFMAISQNRVSGIEEEVDLRYTGHYYHAKSGLYLTPYRAYNSVLGRWINRDPIEENGGINLYGYVSNKPIIFSDPLGLFSCAEICKDLNSAKEGQKVCMKMAKTGVSLKEAGGAVRGSAMQGGDTPILTQFENSWGESAIGLATHVLMQTIGRAVGAFTATTPVNFNSLFGMAEVHRHQRYIDQLEEMAKAQGCNCN